MATDWALHPQLAQRTRFLQLEKTRFESASVARVHGSCQGPRHPSLATSCALECYCSCYRVGAQPASNSGNTVTLNPRFYSLSHPFVTLLPVLPTVCVEVLFLA